MVGEDFAKENGYSPYSVSPNSATYIKQGVFLTCRNNGTARLEKVIGMVRCVIDEFSYPNKYFPTFEAQIGHVVCDVDMQPPPEDMHDFNPT